MRLSLPAEFTIASPMLYPLFLCWLGWAWEPKFRRDRGWSQSISKRRRRRHCRFRFFSPKRETQFVPFSPKTLRFALPRVYINNIGADRIVRCVRVMMSTHRSECFDCKSTLDWPNAADGITEAVRKCSKKAGYFQSIPCGTLHSYYQIQLEHRQKGVHI